MHLVVVGDTVVCWVGNPETENWTLGNPGPSLVIAHAVPSAWLSTCLSISGCCPGTMGLAFGLLPWHWPLDLAWLPCCVHLPLAAGTHCGHSETRMGLLKGLGIFNVERGSEGESRQWSSDSGSTDLPRSVPWDKDPESPMRWQEYVSREGNLSLSWRGNLP